MSVRCKSCCVATSLAIMALAGVGGWTLWRDRQEPVVTPEKTRANPHAKAPEVLAGALERLHAEALAHFHADPKNGYARMPPVFEKVVKEWKTPWFSSGELDRQEEIPFVKDMQHIHDGSLKNFLAPHTLQAKADARTYAIITEAGKYDRNRKAWEAKSIDLIGLVKSDTPVVYVSEKVAEWAGDGELPTRPLDEFELAGLHDLAKGDNLFGRSREGVIRLLGAVRAESSCVACHEDKKEGDLLGAFSYVLREAEYKRGFFGGRKSAPTESKK